MAQPKNSYELTILNQRFTIKSDNDEGHVKLVADFVNKKMHDIVTRNKAISTSNVAILTALNIADDLFKLRKDHRSLVEGWMGKVQQAVEALKTE